MTTQDGLRDTGRAPKIPDEKRHMSDARAFDTLAETNLRVVATIASLAGSMRNAILAMVVCGLLASIMTAASGYMLWMGQRETRELIQAITRRDCMPFPKLTQKE